MAKRTLITARKFGTSGPHVDLLKRAGFHLEFKAEAHNLSAEALAKLLPGVDGVILGVDDCNAHALAHADKLKVISRFGVGFDNVDLEAASRKGIVVARAVGANASAVVELTLGMMFALARQLVHIAGAARQKQWLRPPGFEIGGKTLGIIGLGIIGKQVAAKAHCLGMRVVAYDAYVKGFDNVNMLELDELLKTADIVTLHCNLNDKTRNLLDRTRLAQMKKGSYLINTARGALVDEDALYNALQREHLAGAAMDAFAQEPPVNSPLLELDNFIATPHIGANTVESSAKVALLAAQNLVDIFAGRPCPNIVNPEVYKGAS